MRNAVIGKRPSRSQLPGSLAGAMPTRGGENEVRTDAPSKSGLTRIRPGHDKQVEQLCVPESGPCRRTFSQRLGHDLKGGPYDLFQIQGPVRLDCQNASEDQGVWLSIGAVLAGRILVLDLKLR